jgi:hypothetical protein
MEQGVKVAGRQPRLTKILAESPKCRGYQPVNNRRRTFGQRTLTFPRTSGCSPES